MAQAATKTKAEVVTGQTAQEFDGLQGGQHWVIFSKSTTIYGVERTKIEATVGAITRIVSMGADGAEMISRIVEMGEMGAVKERSDSNRR